ncbi:FG-GAP-like repeat-containing protein [Cyclobacteriaceae bacterium]|nr:FG-GAP-like repeat-containing protein [Cyclobacteriaceae bacterium]
MKNLSKKLIIISSFIFGALHLSAQTVVYDSIADDDSRQDTLTFVEDFADAKYALNALFVSDDSLTFKLNKINANGAISATVADDTLTISALANGYGQASVEVSATNTADLTVFSQLISVIVTAVDDAPTLNPDNRFVDYYSNQLSANTNVLIDCVNGFEDVDDDGYGLTITFTNLSNAAAGYTDLDTSMVTDIGNGQFNIAVAASTKYAGDVHITADASGKSFTKTVKLVIDNAPALIDAEDPITVNEDFASFKKKANVLFADADNGDPDSIKVTFADYLADSLEANTAGIIENDTNNIVRVTYEVAEDEFTFTSQADKIGTYKLPVSVTSGFRTVNDTMTVVVNNVDDKATIVNSIPDQLLPQGTRIAVSIDEIFEDIDNDLDYTKFVLSTSNATALKIQKLNTNGTYSDLSSPHTLVAGQSTLYILASGSVDDKGSIKFESDDVGTSTASVNGAISSTTALVVDNNAGDIKVGDLVTGTGIVGTVRVEKVTDQNNIILTSAQSLSDNAALTFTASLTEFFTLKISRAIGVFHVTKTGDDNNNGTSISTAFATIGKAILAAQNRDTIKIGEGTYTENLVINEGLTIQSTSYSTGMSDADIKKTIIKGTVNGGSVVSILNTEGVTIRGLAIQGSGDINTDETGSSRGWVYEDGTVVTDAIVDALNWNNEDSKSPNQNNNDIRTAILRGDNGEVETWDEWGCCIGIWIEAPTVTAVVNGSISGATAVALDGNVGTIEVGDIVTGDGISETVTVASITNQNDITLSKNISLADDKDLTFTFPDGDKDLRFTVGNRSFYTVPQGFNYADAVQNVTENIPQATIIKVDSEAIWNKMDDADYGWNFIGLSNIILKSTKGAGVAVSEASVDLDFVHIYDHQVSESDWINAAGVFAQDAKKINISNSSIYNNDVQNGDGAGIGIFWSQELSVSNTTVYDNNAVGDNNCTAGGLMTQGLDKLTVLNSMFYDNEARCDHSVRIGRVQEYSVNHTLIENGLNFQDVENYTGVVQNSIFLNRPLAQWGATKPSKLTIQNNLINGNVHLDYEIDRYGANNLLGASTAFVDAANRDYQLSSSSVLIGAGIASSDVLDIKGTARPNPAGSKPDIGPYENALDKPDLIFAPYFATETSPHCCYYTSVDMFDADNDGIDEVLYIARTDDNDSYIVKLFDAADSTSTTLHEDWSEYTYAKPLDINQDGFLDVVIGNSSKTAYLINNGSGVFAAPTKEYSDNGIDLGYAQRMVWGDITGDGRIDGLRGDWSGIIIYEFLSDGPRVSSKQLNNINNEWLGDFNNAFVADINGDTKTDLILERRWNGQSQAQDLFVYLQEDGDLIYNAGLSLIDKLPGAGQDDNSDRDLTLDFGDLDGDGAGDLLVAYTPNKANTSSGALKRFELTNNDSTWTEVALNLRISSDSVIAISDYYGAVFAPKIAVLKDSTVSIVALVSNENEGEWDRYFVPGLFNINASGELEQKKGYYSSETFTMNPWDSRINYDLGRLNSGAALDMAFHGRLAGDNRNKLVMFTNTNTVTPTGDLAAPSLPTITIAGSKVKINFATSSDYYNIKICSGANCNTLYTTSTGGGVADVSGLVYTGAGAKELEYFLEKGTYSVSIQNIDSKFGVSAFVSSPDFVVEGLDFAASTELMDDFFNEVHLINMDADVKPEAYGYKRRFWAGSGEESASMKIFDLDNNNFKSFKLDNEASVLIGDFDSNGKPDVIVDNHSGDWPTTPFYSLMNIDENSAVSVFSESFTKLPTAIAGGRHGSGITASNRAIDIDQDGRDELVTGYANTWGDHDGGIGLFAIEADDFSDTTALWLRGEDANFNGDYKGAGPLFWSKMDGSGRSDYRGMAHTYLNPDKDGDTDHLIAINMSGSGLARSALYVLESKSSGSVQEYYLNSFADKSILDMQVFGEDASKITIMLSYTDDNDYWSDAFRTREIFFLKLEISKSEDFFQELKKAMENVTTLMPVNYKSQTSSAIAYSDFALEGMPVTNSFAIADINNDGLNDIVGVGSNTSDTWNGQAILNFYLQNANGGLDQYISQVATEAKNFSFISSINLIDINADQKVDVVVSGRTRQSNNGNTLGFINNTEMDVGGALSAPTELMGQNNGFKVELKWSDTNSGKIGYAAQVGTAADNFDLNRGNLNASGYPLFPDRFESFQKSKRQVFDAYDLADAYYFKLKAIDQYGNTSAFSAVETVITTEPFTKMDQAIPGISNGNIAWGDYDRDGDLDLALMGTEQGYITKLYRNDSGVFVDSNNELARQSEGDLGWVDFDNDGYLDLVVTGKDLEAATVLNIYKNNGAGSLVKIDNGTPIDGVTDATLAFGDSDADGDIDMVLAGLTVSDGQINYIMNLYENKYNTSGGDVIFDRNDKFYREGFTKGDIEFADLDNDGDLEIIYAGTGKGDNPVGGIIANTRAGLTGGTYDYSGQLQLGEASISVGDIDSDGDLDIIATGISGRDSEVRENVTRIFTNEYYAIDSLRAYIEFNVRDNDQIQSLADGDIDMIDFDNDGDLDLLVSGKDNNALPTTILYAQAGGSFFVVKTPFDSVMQSSVRWADFDTDGDMDVFISGKTTSKSITQLFENNTGNIVNKAPDVPTNLKVTDFGFGKVRLSWDRSNDDYTEKSSVSYVIALGDSSGVSNLFTTESNLETGTRLTAKPSAALQDFLYLELDPGAYHFAVQAVDANYSGSAFSAFTPFEMSYAWKELNLGGIVDNKLPAGEDASLKFSDFDGDGDFDLGIFGKNPDNQWELGLLGNNAGSFNKIYDFESITKGDFDWADVNGDGTLDVFMTGEDPNDETRTIANLYLNYSDQVGAEEGDDGFDDEDFEFDISALYGEWELLPVDGALWVGDAGILNTDENTQTYWELPFGERDCFTDDVYSFEPDGGFSVSYGETTWVENWQVNEGDESEICSAPIAPFDNDHFGSFAVINDPNGDGDLGALVLEGSGSFLGLPKAYNGGELTDGTDPMSIGSRTYEFVMLNKDMLLVQMDIGAGIFWQIALGRKGVWSPEDFMDDTSVGGRLMTTKAENDFTGNVNFGFTGIPFKPLVNAKAKFIDFDNDGLPELIYAGSTSSTSAGVAAVYVYYFDNMNGNLQAYELQLENEFPVLTGSSIAFGDVDNDQDYDLILAGSSPSFGRVTDVYLNEGNNEAGQLIMVKDEANEGLITGVSDGTLDLVDFDNDGDLDLVVSGDSFDGDVLKLYRNDEGQYTSISETLSGLAAMKNGRTSWGDFDGDGNADMLYSGEVVGKGEFTGLALYDTLTKTYKEDDFDLSQFTNAAVAFGDYDGDNDLDMALTGVNKNYDANDPGSNKYISKLYVNVRNESAALDAEGAEAGRTATVGKFKVNKPPSPPKVSAAKKVDNAPALYSFRRPSNNDNNSSGRNQAELQMMEFSWSASEDDNTASAGLTYALRIGTSQGGGDILDANANQDGSRTVSGKGNAEHNTTWKVALGPGTYFWAVQALDPSYASSIFSEEQTFTLNEDGGVEINEKPDIGDAEFVMRDIAVDGFEVGQVMGTDPDGDAITYAIFSGNDEGIFEIASSSGLITLADADKIDFETQSTYLLGVTGKDDFLVDTAYVSITLEQNVAPVGESGSVTISETLPNGAEIFQLVATDENNDQVQFTIIEGNEGGALALSENGALTVANTNALFPETIVLTISVSDDYGAESDFTFSIVVEEEVLGFNEVLRAVRAYPNPTAGKIEIEIASGSQLEIVVSDLSGRIVQTKQVNRTGVTIDIADEVAGIYLMTVKDLNSSDVRTFRIVKF